LLLLSRADQRSFAREHVDLSLIAEEATETLLPFAEKRAVTIETSGDITPTIGSHALLLGPYPGPMEFVERDTIPAIGASARRTRTVTARDIEAFTEITGDHNPIHYDEELAKSSRFGGIVVQGGVTSGLLNALVAEQLPGPGSVFLEVAWRFLAPVRPGDVISAEATVTAAREDKSVTTLATRITNQDGVTVLDGTAVVWRDPAIAALLSA
jgi:acyl dehydratase